MVFGGKHTDTTIGLLLTLGRGSFGKDLATLVPTHTQQSLTVVGDTKRMAESHHASTITACAANIYWPFFLAITPYLRLSPPRTHRLSG